MLYLKQDFSNVVLMSLKDRTTNSFYGVVTWSYLFNFTNDMSKESYTTIVVITNDVVTYNDANDIIIKLRDKQTGAIDSNNGEIKLTPKGYWSYEVYEQNSLTNLDITDNSVIGKVESGKAFIYDGTDEVNYTQHKDTTNTTNYIYTKD